MRSPCWSHWNLILQDAERMRTSGANSRFSLTQGPNGVMVPY